MYTRLLACFTPPARAALYITIGDHRREAAYEALAYSQVRMGEGRETPRDVDGDA